MNPVITIFGLSGQSIFMTVEQFHQPGETLVAKSIFEEFGGKGHNQAVACSRLNATVNFVGAFGRDENSKEAIIALQRENINVYPIYKDLPTAYATILTDIAGENRVTVYQGASSCLVSEDIDSFETLIKQSDIVLLQLEIPVDVIAKIIRIANSYNVKVILNPAPAKKLFNIGKIYALTPNQQEASIINCNEIDSDVVIITSGKSDTVVRLKEQDEISVPTIDVKAVDTTGAGDVFNGALAVMIAQGKPIVDAVKFANVAAGLSTTKAHVIESIPYLDDVKKKMKELAVDTDE